MAYESTLLREGLLRGRRVAVSGPVATEVREALVALGAEVRESLADPGAESAQTDVAHTHALVHDASTTFARAGLTPALQETWSAIAQAANSSMIPRGEGGKVVLLAPRPDAGAHAQAARDALENLARTLSTEWARYQITTTAIAPGEDTRDEDLAALVCFLLSRAGDYFSGCRFDLGAVRAPRAMS